MECIVLAGGLGTRLRGTIGDYPKCMAEVNGKPFLHYIFEMLALQGCSKIILSLGYKHEVITEWIATTQRNFAIDYVIEEQPLGTGGGIQLAMQKATDANVLVFNGDTLFRIDANKLLQYHEEKGAATTLVLKEMYNFERYGTVHTDDNGCILSFEEKKPTDIGWINGGIYAINRQAYLNKQLPEKHSFEKDYLEAYIHEHTFYGMHSDAYFIDIGIPEDYARAQQDFKTLFG